VCLTRCDVRDHINYRKNGRWRSYQFYRALQRLKSPTCDICEIFRDPAIFEFFNTIGAKRPLRCANINLACLRWPA
jgi:hypothetical protein